MLEPIEELTAMSACPGHTAPQYRCLGFFPTRLADTQATLQGLVPANQGLGFTVK